MNRIVLFALLLFGIGSAGCTVGAKVGIHASTVEYPVSQSSSFYSPEGELIISDNYELLEPFSFNFKKWGVSSVFEIKTSADISQRLNHIIEEQGGDAIVDLTISVRNTTSNSFMLFLKSSAFITALITTPLTISEPKPVRAAVATGSLLSYLFMPGNADIKIEGTVIRLLDENPTNAH